MTKYLVTVSAILAIAVPTTAQTPATTIGFGFGLFAEYPQEFLERGCDGTQGGFTARIGRHVKSSVAVELGVTWTGDVGTTQCVTPNTSAPAPPDGTPFTTLDVGDAIDGVTFFSSHAAVLAEPWRFGPFAPRLRVSAGRVWDKQLWTWTYGAGGRYSLGSHSLVLDVERWNLSYDVRLRSWIFRERGPDELVSDTVTTRSPRPWLFRLGWEMAIG